MNFLNDIVVVKTCGKRSYFDSKSKTNETQVANVYLHYLTNCLVQFDVQFNFSKLVVPKVTQNGLSVGNLDGLKKKGCKFL